MNMECMRLVPPGWWAVVSAVYVRSPCDPLALAEYSPFLVAAFMTVDCRWPAGRLALIGRKGKTRGDKIGKDVPNAHLMRAGFFQPMFVDDRLGNLKDRQSWRCAFSS
jgi:hypothetical protein